MSGDRPLAVRVVVNALGEGGTERSMAELTPHLARRGVELRYAILRSRGEEGVEFSLRDDGVCIDVLPPGRARVGALHRLMEDAKDDLVHSMLFDANLTARLAVARSRLNRHRIPVMTSIVNEVYSKAHRAASNTPGWKYRAVQAADALTGLVMVDRFHAVSNSAALNARRVLRIPRKRITVVGRGRSDPRGSVEGGERQRIRAALGISPEAFVVVCIGRQEPQKDLPTLIKAMAPVLDDDHARLVLVGRTGNATTAVEAAGAEVHGRKRILMLGHRSDVPALLAASDIFAMSSHFEGMPGAVIEAMAMGLPVVASDIGPVREVVEPDGSALLAPVGNADAFRERILRLRQDLALRARLGNRGREIFEERFDIACAADAMARLYRDVAERNS